MKRRTARKVIKYGMYSLRGRYGTYLKAIAVLPTYYNFLKFQYAYTVIPGKAILQLGRPSLPKEKIYNDIHSICYPLNSWG